MHRPIHTPAATALLLFALATTTALGGPAHGEASSASKLATRALRALAATVRADRLSRDALASAAVAGVPGVPGAEGPPGPDGPTGAVGDPGERGDRGPSMFGATIPPGVTVTGVWGGSLPRAGTDTLRLTVAFPAAAPAPLADADVGFAPHPRAGDPLPNQCGGTVAAPTARPGSVCLYIAPTGGSGNLQAAVGSALAADPNAAQNALGFAIELTPTIQDPDPPLDTVRATGTWAYTAP